MAARRIHKLVLAIPTLHGEGIETWSPRGSDVTYIGVTSTNQGGLQTVLRRLELEVGRQLDVMRRG